MKAILRLHLTPVLYSFTVATGTFLDVHYRKEKKTKKQYSSVTHA